MNKQASKHNEFLAAIGTVVDQEVGRRLRPLEKQIEQILDRLAALEAASSAVVIEPPDPMSVRHALGQHGLPGDCPSCGRRLRINPNPMQLATVAPEGSGQTVIVAECWRCGTVKLISSRIVAEWQASNDRMKQLRKDGS